MLSTTNSLTCYKKEDPQLLKNNLVFDLQQQISRTKGLGLYTRFNGFSAQIIQYSPLNSANLCSISEVTLSSKCSVLLPPIPSAYLPHPCHKEFFQTHLYWQQTLLLSTLQSGNGLAKDNQILAAGSQTFKPKSVQKIKNRATIN